MSALVLTLLRFGFLLLLWIFVIGLALTLRRDVYGTLVRDRSALRNTRKDKPVRAVSAPAQPVERRTPPALTLAVTAGPLAGTILPLGQAPVVVGRSPDSALVLNDSYSSSRHARIFQSNGEWWVEDLDSTNGTFVGGQRISAPMKLRPGVPVVVGKTTLELRQ